MTIRSFIPALPFKRYLISRRYKIPKETTSAGALNTRGVGKSAIYDGNDASSSTMSGSLLINTWTDGWKPPFISETVQDRPMVTIDH